MLVKNSQSYSELVLVCWNLGFLQQSKKRNHFVCRHHTNDRDSFKKCGDRWVATHDSGKLYHLHCTTWHMKDIFVTSRGIIGCSLFPSLPRDPQFLVRDMSDLAKKCEQRDKTSVMQHKCMKIAFILLIEKSTFSLKNILSSKGCSFYFYAEQPDIKQNYGFSKSGEELCRYFSNGVVHKKKSCPHELMKSNDRICGSNITTNSG